MYKSIKQSSSHRKKYFNRIEKHLLSGSQYRKINPKQGVIASSIHKWKCWMETLIHDKMI